MAQDELTPTPDHGFAPPQNLEAEENVLGAMMISENAALRAAEILRPEDFYRFSHGAIFRAAVTLANAGKPIDAVTLVDILERTPSPPSSDSPSMLEEVGGRVRIHEISALVPASANVAHWAEIVRETAILRGLIRGGGEIAHLAWERNDEVAVLVDRAEQIIFEVATHQDRKEFSRANELVREAYTRIQELYDAADEVTGTPSGYRVIDRVVSGFQPGNLIILAARPSMGKSGLALCISTNLTVRHHIPVAFFSLEMSKQEVMMRCITSEARVNSQMIRTGQITQADWDRIKKASDAIAEAPLFVDDSGTMTLSEIRAKVKRLAIREKGLGLIVIDYLQLMASGTKAENRVQEVSQMTRALKILARDLATPILVLSQLNRGVEARTDKRPILSDLRESGSIEQDADVVMMIYRDEYYNKDTSDSRGVAEINVAKNRNGPTRPVHLAFVEKYAKFADLAQP